MNYLNQTLKRETREKKAFSLLELLVVLTVVGLLLSFAAPNLFSLVQARTLSNEGSLLRNQLTFAQQMAVSKNADVEIRFYKWKDESAAEDEEQFSAFQLFQYNSGGEMKPISSFFRIKAPTVIDEKYSTLLEPRKDQSRTEKKYGFVSPVEGTAQAPTGVLESMTDTRYVSFRFRPDGSTDLPNKSGDNRDTWYITLVQGEGANQGMVPRNYVCLQVNPYNGAVTQYRP